MGGKDKEVKRRDLGPKGERVRYLNEERKLEMVFGWGLGKESAVREGISSESRREKTHSAKLGENCTACLL